MDDTTPGQITSEHRAYLEAHAVNVELAASLGVRSLIKRADVAGLPEPWDSFANVPALLFPWTGPGGRVEIQMRPDNPTVDSRGKPRKYMFRKGMEPVLWAVCPVAESERIIVVEGTKQCLAAASYAPPGVAVYGMAGCRMWQHDGTPIPDLGVADGRDVVIILDADAAENVEVYNAGANLADALEMEGATSVKFARLPASGKSGLDDVLAGRAPERRTGYLARLIDSAKTKPADAKPRVKPAKVDMPTDTERSTIVCNRDRLFVINELTDALITRWDGRELFNHGGVISRLKDRTMVPVDRGAQRDLIQETAITVDEIEDKQGVRYHFTWPDANSISAVMSRSERFSKLERVSNAPFARPDGTIVTEPGYDRETGTMLVPDPALQGLTVPETPTPGEIETARELLLTEWLGDFPFATDADWANVLALMVTPAIRGLVPRVPLAVVDGLQMGVGKNLLADSILTVYTGEAARPMNFVDEKEELRKQITSAFRTGAEFFVFDEAHTIEGAALAQALTASTWQDRILGVSTMAEFPNRVTWISLGNNVQVRGDLTRRVYRIALRPNYANPQDRSASSFRHPGQSGLDLGSWTRKHRRELMTAILTLVRAWFADGQPYPARGVSFGSFETWERYVGGIVETAGLSGFLGDLKTWRSESDFDSQYWIGHLKWLLDEFGDAPFRTGEVREKALTDPAGFMAPPKLDDPTDKIYPKLLGEAYSRLRGRRYDGVYVERAGSVKGHVSLWVVREDNTLITTTPPQRGNDGGNFGEPGGRSEAGGSAPGGGEIESERSSQAIREDCQCSGEGTGSPGSTRTATPEGGDDPRKDPNDWRERRVLDETRDVGVPAVKPGVEVVALDLETGDADDLYNGGPEYIRLAGVAHGGHPVAVIDRDNHADVFAGCAVRTAGTLTGHNIMAFDLPALVNAGVLDMVTVHAMARDGRLFDALLAARHLDPPMARDHGVDADRRYGLDAVGIRYGLGGKSDAAKALAKKYGGWGAIPIDADHPDGAAFREYLVRDVELSRDVYTALMADLGGTVPDYLVREHRVAAIAAQISVNGFRVDVPELQRKVDEINALKAESLKLLAARYGLPLHDAKGKAYKAPLGTKAGKYALEKAFREAGATSVWTTGKTGQIDVSADHMRHIADEYGYLPKVVELARLVYRIVGARTVYETVANNLVGDRVHPRVSFKQATGRWSLTKPGLTVMGKRGGRHVERNVFLPDPGGVILTADLSQVDMRAVAGLSQDQAYIDMLKQDDPHTEIAIALFGDASRRSDAKAIGHGWNYGRGIRAISESQDIEPSLVRQFDTSMRERFGRLVEWQGEVRALAESGALLDNGFGRPMRPDPQRAHTQGPALMGQGAARDIMMTGLLNLADRYPETLPMLRAQVHDEIVLSVPRDVADDVAKAVVECLTFEWRGVPITADAGPLGGSWGACYEK